MDWKLYYRAERERPQSRELINSYFAAAATDSAVDRAITNGAILSFPHTALGYAGPLQARVIAGLYRIGVPRIIALGVLHTSALPEPYSGYLVQINDAAAPTATRAEALAMLTGAFFPTGEVISTSFGTVPLVPIPPRDVVRADTGILKNEFSLDTFLSLLAFHAAQTGTVPPPVAPLYIGITYDPVHDSFAVAGNLAGAIRELITPGTAIVTTGDLVHYGTAYSAPERVAAMPTDRRALEEYFLPEVEDTIARGLAGEHKLAFDRARAVLASDQRYILPVITELLGGGAGYEILHFELSDYAGILSVAPPCYVASSLVAFIPPRFC